jgi:hypothetical protein
MTHTVDVFRGAVCRTIEILIDIDPLRMAAPIAPNPFYRWDECAPRPLQASATRAGIEQQAEVFSQ